jgi:pimeloyl-ACP methyl ester carboxylesterase
VASEHPELLRSVTLAEPIIAALLANSPERKSVLADQGKTVAAVSGAVKAGDSVQAIKLYFEAANNQGAGAFEKQPDAIRRMILENARTVPLMIAAPAPPAVSCGSLGGLKVPTLVVGGKQSAQFYSLINEEVVRCTPGSRMVRIPQATHWMSMHNPAAFNEALLQFLAQH